jgi:hypothetical protein
VQVEDDVVEGSFTSQSRTLYQYLQPVQARMIRLVRQGRDSLSSNYSN